MSKRPGKIKEIIKIDNEYIPSKRREDNNFTTLYNKIWDCLEHD